MSIGSIGIPCPVVCGLPLGGSSILKGASDKVASSVMSTFSSWVVQGATWLIVHALSLVVPETSPELSAKWLAPREGSMLQIAALLVGPLLAAATIGAVLRQDGRRLVRVWAVGLPVGVLCASTAVALTNLALKVVNAMCELVTPPHGYAAIRGLGTGLTEHGAPAFVQFIIASLMVLAGLVLWMELVLRSVVLYIAVFFLPLGLAAFIWPTTAHITKRFVELIVAVIGSKFVIVATLTLGSAAVGSHDTIDGVVTGAAILLLAAFAPYSLLRLIPLVEGAAISHLEGTSRRPAQAAVGGARQATSSGRRMAGSVAGLLAGPEGGVAAAGVGAVDIGERVGDWTPPAPGVGSDPGGGTIGGAGGGSSNRTGSSGSGSSGSDSSGSGSGSGSAGLGSSGTASQAGSSGGGIPTAGVAFDNRGGSAGGAPGDSPSASASVPRSSWSSPTVVAPSTGGDAEAGRAPVVAGLPRVVPGSAGPDLDGWTDDE